MNFNGLLLGGLRHFAQDVGKTVLGRRIGLIWIRWIVCVCAQAATHWNVPGKYGPQGELFFFLIQTEQVVASNEALPNPYVSAETLQGVCGDWFALFGSRR